MNNKISNILVLLCLVVIICLIVVSCANQRQENVETITNETTNDIETKTDATSLWIETKLDRTSIYIQTEPLKTNETSISIETESIKTEESFLITETETFQTTYVIYVYDEGQNGQYESSIVRPQIELFVSNISNKQGVGRKSIELFNELCNFAYDRTIDYGIYDESYDSYVSAKCFIQIGEKTGRIGSFSHGNPQNVKFNCTPPVNEHSSSQEFVDYAREVLSKYNGISTNDLDVEIKTQNIRTNYKYTKEELNQAFINFIDHDPSFSAEYKITFYKKLGGLNRIDDISVTIKNDGTVMYFNCKLCDEKFEKFLNVEINKELVVEMVDSMFKGITSNLKDVERTETKLSVVPDGDNLWVLANVYYKFTNYGERFGNVHTYLIRIL